MIYIVLLNWNNAVDTIACLRSLESLEGPSFKVIVADNASHDGSYAAIREHLVASPLVARCGAFLEPSNESTDFRDDSGAGVVLIQTGANLGFAGGNNVAIRFAMAQADLAYVWLLNNDTEVEPDTLIELVKGFTSDSRIGICGSRLIYAHDRTKLQALGGQYNPWFATSKHLRAFEDADADYSDAETSQLIDYVVGASMLVSRRFLTSVGLMSEEYFLYYEELDWAVRARRAGFTLHVATRSRVYHKEGGTINAGAKRRSELSERCYLNNRLLVTRKFFSRYLPSVWCFGLAIALRRLLQRDSRGFGIAVRALFK